MSNVTAPLAHHFDSLEQQRESVNLGMWLFLVQEVLFFGGLFAVYLVYRTQYAAAFTEGSHHLNITLGATNTVVLICSSLTMALAVRAAQLGHKKKIIGFLLATAILGTVFLGIKTVEYSHKYHEHLIPGSHFAAEAHHASPQNLQLFFSIYFCMTGLHALHMIVGLGLLIWLMVGAAKDRYGPDYYNPVEGVGLYWHFVDIVWIYLFPLLYLIGRT